MAEAVLMPQVGISVETCIITEWQKKLGDRIEEGDILFTYETDKSSLECESTASGELLEIFFHDGDEVPVLTAVCAIGEAGEDVSSLRPSGMGEEAPEVPTEAPTTPPVETAAPAVAAAVTGAVAIEGERIKISPRARGLAKDQNIDITQAAPTGPYGRIIERDIRQMMADGIGVMTSAAFAEGTGISSGTSVGGRVGVGDLGRKPAAEFPETPDYQDVALSGIRRAISRSMTHSLASIPQLTHNHSFDASEILRYRKQLKEVGEGLGLPNITLNDIILYAVSRMLPKYPELNAHMLDGETIRYFTDVHLGVAVDTPRGLMVPVIPYANHKSLAEISLEASALIEQAIAGSISPDKLSGGTFTVTNLGTLGVESFTPVINPPETGILGVDNIITRVRDTGGDIETYPAMGLSLTYDHRAIDGAPASRFASELCKMLENFSIMLAQ